MIDSKLYDVHGAHARLDELTGGAGPAVASLNKLAVIGGGPPFRRFGRQRIYGEEDLVAWVKSRMSAKVSSTAELPRCCGNPMGRGRPRKDAQAATRAQVSP